MSIVELIGEADRIHDLPSQPGCVKNGVVGEVRRGVILYGHDVEAVAEALREFDPRFVLGDRVAAEAAQVPVLCCPNGPDADAARESTPGIAWLVVEFYWPGADVEHARDPVLYLNASKVDPGLAARAIDQPDLVVWYEVINPVRVVTVDGGPAAADYSNLMIIEPDGHRMVAHAVRTGGAAPECLNGDAELVLPSHDLWALAGGCGGPSCARRTSFDTREPTGPRRSR